MSERERERVILEIIYLFFLKSHLEIIDYLQLKDNFKKNKSLNFKQYSLIRNKKLRMGRKKISISKINDERNRQVNKNYEILLLLLLSMIFTN